MKFKSTNQQPLNSKRICPVFKVGGGGGGIPLDIDGLSYASLDISFWYSLIVNVTSSKANVKNVNMINERKYLP